MGMKCTFNEWMESLFNYPDGFDMISQNPLCLCDLPDAELIAYITQAFENAESVFALYSHEQISQTLWYLIGSGSDIAPALLNNAIPWANQERCIRSFYTLFEQL